MWFDVVRLGGWLVAGGLLSASLVGCGVFEGEGPCEKGDVVNTMGDWSRTDLDVDCRCSDQLLYAECGTLPQGWANLRPLGDGPDPAAMAPEARYWYGDLWADRGEIILAVALDSNVPGFVLALDTETGDRRVVSGRYLSPGFEDVVVGEGELWGRPTYALRGLDDELIVYTHQTTVEVGQGDAVVDHSLWRVDVDTGDRERIWQWSEDGSNGYPQCARENGVSYQLGIEGRSFDINEADGSMYLPTIGARGVIKIARDGSSCEVVTNPDVGVGEGPAFFAVESINHVDGQLLVGTNDLLYLVDEQTGNRQAAGGIPPGRWQYLEGSDWMHLTGVPAPYGFGVYSLNLETNDFIRWSCSNLIGDVLDPETHFSERCIDGGNGMTIGPSNQGWMLPGEEYMIHVSENLGFAKIEARTGNANWFSM